MCTTSRDDMSIELIFTSFTPATRASHVKTVTAVLIDRSCADITRSRTFGRQYVRSQLYRYR